MKSKRRDFLSSSALLLGGFTSGLFSNASGSFAQENIPGAESWNLEPGVRKKDDKLLNIGGIFGLWSHTSSTWWRYLNPPQGHARATGMRITHLWSVDKEAGRRLAKRYDATLVDSYDDLWDGTIDIVLGLRQNLWVKMSYFVKKGSGLRGRRIYRIGANPEEEGGR